MARERTVIEKVGDWKAAYDMIRDEITPAGLRQMMAVVATPPADGSDVQQYIGMVQASLSMARIVTANDRMAAVTAAMLTQSGVSRPIIADAEGDA